MNNLTKTTAEVETAKRELRRTGSLRDLLNASKSGTTALLCDVSGSMNTLILSAPNKRRIDALIEAIKDLPKIPTIAFGVYSYDNGTDVMMFPDQSAIPTSGGGGTPLAEALELAKMNGFIHVVVVTDGQPNNQNAALQAAEGLRVDAIYVSDPPVPQFLVDLCNRTGGSYQNVSIETPKELGTKILALIEGTVS